MAHSRLLKEMDSREISEWIAYFQIESKQDKEKTADELKAKFQSLAPPKVKDGARKSKS